MPRLILIYKICIFCFFNYNTKAQSLNFKYDGAEKFAEQLAQVYIGEKTGYINTSGKEIVPIIYDKDYLNYPFENGVAIVMLNKLYGLIDKNGKLIVPCQYKSIGRFYEGISEVINKEGKVGFIDNQGKIVIPFNYSISIMLGGAKCINGLIPVKNSAGRNGYIDKTNKLVVPFLYEVHQNFSDGMALVKKEYNGKITYFNAKGAIAIPEKYDDGTAFIDGTAIVNIGAKEKTLFSGLEGGKWGVIDKTGKEVLPIIYDDVIEIKNGLTVVANGKYPNIKKGLLGKNGKQILSMEYYDIKILENRIIANKAFIAPYALFDYNGKQLGDFKWHFFDMQSGFSDGLLRIQEVSNNVLGYVGAIDDNGVIKIPLKFNYINSFEKGIATASIGKKYGVIDKFGKTIIPFDYEYINKFYDGWAIVSSNKKYGFINKAGKLMELTKTDNATIANENKSTSDGSYKFKRKFADGYLVETGASLTTEKDSVFTGTKMGVLDKNEKLIIPIKYDYIDWDKDLKIYYLYEGWRLLITKGKTWFDSSVIGTISIADFSGKILFPNTFKKTIKISNGYTFVLDAKSIKFGVLNDKIKLIIPTIYDLIKHDSINKLFFVHSTKDNLKQTNENDSIKVLNSKIGILDYSGEQLYPPSFSYYKVLPNKYIIVKETASRKYGILNSACKLIVPHYYDLIYAFADSTLAAKKNGKYGIINLKNEILFAFEIDTLFGGGDLAPGGYLIRKNGKNILIDAKGKLIESAPEPFETNFQTALKNAWDSKARSEALMIFLNSVYLTTDSISFSKLVKQKINQVASIDFYAIHQMIMKNKDKNQYLISKFMLNSFTDEQRKVIKKYSECIIDTYTRNQNGQSDLPCPPIDTPQPGKPWKN